MLFSLATERFLQQNGISNVKVIPVVIFGNERTQIRNYSDNAIIRISELYNFIEKLDMPEIYTKEEQQ